MALTMIKFLIVTLMKKMKNCMLLCLLRMVSIYELSYLNKNENVKKMNVDIKLTSQSIITMRKIGRKSSMIKPGSSARPFLTV